MRERLCAERVHTGWKLATADGTYTALYSFPEGECRVVARTVAMTAQAQATHAELAELVPETLLLLEIEYQRVRVGRSAISQGAVMGNCEPIIILEF